MSDWQCALCTSIGGLLGRAKSDRSICAWCEADLTRRGLMRCRRCNVVCPQSTRRPRNCTACERQRARERTAAQDETARAQRQAKKRAAPSAQPEVRRARYAAKREQFQAAQQARRATPAGRERKRVQNAAYRARKKAEARSYRQAYRAAHPEIIRAQEQRAYQRRKLALWKARISR